jgi:hypothetical protein
MRGAAMVPAPPRRAALEGAALCGVCQPGGLLDGVEVALHACGSSIACPITARLGSPWWRGNKQGTSMEDADRALCASAAAASSSSVPAAAAAMAAVLACRLSGRPLDSELPDARSGPGASRCTQAPPTQLHVSSLLLFLPIAA